MPMIEIHNLRKCYKEKKALNIASLSIDDGQVVGLIGNNGQGKTTLLKLILDLTKPTSGQVLINGSDVGETEDWKRITGSYMNEGYLIEYLKVEEYFSFIGFLNNLDKNELNKRILRFEDFFRGEVLKQKKYIRDFSSGNKCKIGIAAAFIPNPSLIILDEPFAHLDPYSLAFAKSFFKEYAATNRATFIISSHQIDMISSLATRVIVLQSGLVINDISEGNINTNTLYNTVV